MPGAASTTARFSPSWKKPSSSSGPTTWCSPPSSPCPIWTRKPSTSDLLPSCSPRCADSPGVTWKLCVWSRITRAGKCRRWAECSSIGRDRLSRFPDAWIQAGRFAGTDRAKILDQARIEESLPAAIEAAIDFVEKHSLHGAAIGRVRRTDRWSLPPAAVREAIVNAVAHVDYAQRGAPIRLAIFDDRLEVENPGLLPFGLTIEDLPHGISKLRNRVIGRVFHELGLVEQWGSGAQRMIAACRNSGLPAPRWEEVGTRLRVTIPSKSAPDRSTAPTAPSSIFWKTARGTAPAKSQA